MFSASRAGGTSLGASERYYSASRATRTRSSASMKGRAARRGSWRSERAEEESSFFESYPRSEGQHAYACV